MSSFNKVILMGNLTRTPELRTANDTSVTEFSLAINDDYGNKDNKEKTATFVDVTLWGKSAESLCKWKKQGDSIIIDGRLKMDRWVDKETGKARTKLKVVGNSVTFVGSAANKNASEDTPPAGSGDVLTAAYVGETPRADTPGSEPDPFD